MSYSPVRSYFKENTVAAVFPNLEKELNTQIQEEYRISNSNNQKRTSPLYVIVKILEIQQK